MSTWKPDLPENAHALRAIRLVVKNNDIRNYTAVTFENPYQGCELWLRRCNAFGYLNVVDDAMTNIDVLDKKGDILETYPISRKGFNYLRRSLKFQVER